MRSKRFLAIDHNGDGIFIHATYRYEDDSLIPFCDVDYDDPNLNGFRKVNVPDKKPQVDCPICVGIIKAANTYIPSELRSE